MKKWLKEYWWVLVLGAFSSSLSDEIDTITKVIYIVLLSVFLYIIDYFILEKIFSNTEKKWKNNLKDELKSFLEKNDCREIILVSEYPIISHVVVSELRKKFNFFWIADFFDLWSIYDDDTSFYFDDDHASTFGFERLENAIGEAMFAD